MLKTWLLLVAIFTILQDHRINTFNLDIGNYIRHDGTPDSMFGFSVALHKEQQTSWVIVGAPQADTSNFQQNVRRGGAVYRCQITADSRCQIVPFDSHGNQYNERGEQIDTKSGQWFGATVSSAGIDGPLVACAPRYVYHTMNPRKVERVEPVGTCYLAKDNFQVYTEYSPCRTMLWGYHRQGSCQAGMSAAITKAGDRLFIGAPGSYYWQGQAYSINTDAVYPYKPPRYGQFGEGGQTYSYGLNTNPRDKVYQTGESTAAEDDSYLGYSSAAGDFNGDGVQGIAVGMPRGGGLLGKVLIFSWNMTNQQNITGEQIGSYFGYSLCVSDVDGDKLDDLIIGAPMYTDPNNEGKYEMGRVYIMYQEKYNKFQQLSTRDGVNSRARFGLSLTSLGDINLDGFGDFAVGAPYDGPQGRGAVYIYHGSKTGPLEKHSQVIFAEDVVGIGQISTFGFSVSGGIDLDGNMYPDLVVGAYEANKAITFKSRPVAVMDATTLFESESKLINLEDKNCTVGRDRKQVTCTIINSCLKYHGVNLPTTADIEVSWILDAKKSRNPRMFFLNDEGKNVRNTTMRLYRGKTECRTERVYIADNIRDKLTPLEVEMKFNMRGQSNQPVLSRNARALPEPILDMNRGTVQRDSINIQKNCGPDNVCIPDLRLNIKADDRYLFGSKKPLAVEVLIPNNGEDAFEAGFYMTIPPGLEYRKIEKLGDSKDLLISCTAPSASTNYTLKCDIGNPLPSGKTANFKVILNPAQKHGMAPNYDFYMEANSTNGEGEGANFDNIVKKSINIWVETDLKISGVALDPELHYNISEYVHIVNATKEHEIGPQIVNMYLIGNDGPSTIQESEIFVLIPYETIGGDKLMYLLNQPETSGNIKCDPTIYANEMNLQLDSVLSKKSFLESQGAIDSSTFYGSRTSGSSSSYASSSGTRVATSSGHHISSGSSSGSGSGGKVVYTAEERRKLDAEENLESTGDASYIHRQRAGQAAQSNAEIRNYDTQRAGFGGGGSGGGSHSYSSSWNSSSQGGGPIVTYSASRNRSVIHGPDGRARVYESSTEMYGGGGAGSAAGYRQSSAQAQRSESNQYSANRQNTYLAAGGGSASASSSGGSASGSSTGGSVSGGRGGSSNSGLFKLDDIETEVNVNQDISGLESRTQYGGSQHQSASSSSSDSSAGGKRRMKSQQDGEPMRSDLITGVTSLEKAAQGGRGFQTSSFDLGTLNRDNVDDEIRRRGNAAYGGTGAAASAGGGASASSSHSSSHSWQSGAASGGSAGESQARQHSASSGTQHGGSSGSSYNYHSQSGGNAATGTTEEYEEDDGYGDEEYYEEDNTNQGAAGQHHQSQQYQQAHSSGGSQHQDGVDQRFKHYHRLRREITDDFNELQLNEALQCNRTKCIYLRCVAGPLEKDSNTWIAIRARLVAHTMHMIAPQVPMNLSTMVVARVSRVPYIGEPKEKPLKSYEIVTTAIPIPEPKPDVVPLWVVVLSACAGVIILLLLIYILYKCGFFKRNRPTDSQERQPLNRNGAYHGDEHL